MLCKDFLTVEEVLKNNEGMSVEDAIELIEKTSGTNTNREQLQLLLKVVEEGDIVAIRSIDQLSRNYKECKQLWGQLEGRNIITFLYCLIFGSQFL